MKSIILIAPVFLLASCASHPPKKIVVVPAVEPSRSVHSIATVRVPEQVREYRFGRYVDPGDRSVMHEEHPAYRIERTSRWNLRPDQTVALPTSLSVASAASAPVSNDAVVAEINKQKAATKAVADQAATLNQRLSGLSEVLGQTQQMAKQNLLLQRDIAALKDRLNAMEKELRDKPTGSVGRPAPAPEENW